MKKSILLLIGISFLFFISCKNEKNTQSGNSYVIEANIENGAAYDIDSIYVSLPLISLWKKGEEQKKSEDVIIARAAYNKGNFKINLPENLLKANLLDNIPREKYMQNAASLLVLRDTDSIRMSDPTAQISLPVFFDAYKDGKEVGGFEPVPVGDYEFPYYIHYRYVDKPFTLITEYSSPLSFQTYNVDLKKGWNPMFVISKYMEDESIVRIDIRNDIPADFRWVYHENKY